jgi:hypothetical protein
MVLQTDYQLPLMLSIRYVKKVQALTYGVTEASAEVYRRGLWQALTP